MRWRFLELTEIELIPTKYRIKALVALVRYDPDFDLLGKRKYMWGNYAQVAATVAVAMGARGSEKSHARVFLETLKGMPDDVLKNIAKLERKNDSAQHSLALSIDQLDTEYHLATRKELEPYRKYFDNKK